MRWLRRPSKPADDLEKSLATSIVSRLGVVIEGCQSLLAEGNRHLQAGDFDAAGALYRAALATDPSSVASMVNLGFVLLRKGRAEESITYLRKAASIAPDDADAQYLLGSALLQTSHPPQARWHLERAVYLNPDLDLAWRDLARALHETGLTDQAETVLRAGLELKPDEADLLQFLGNVLAARHRLPEAIDVYRRSLDISPHQAGSWSNLAVAFASVGMTEAAVDAAESALAIDPGHSMAGSNLLLALSVDGHCSPQLYLQAADRVATIVASSPTAAHARWPRIDAPRQPRIGFVSGDLRSHPVGYFLAPVFEHWDASSLDAVVYNNHPSRDALTDRLQRNLPAWRDVWTMDDDHLAQTIEADRIDLLIDLSGHTPGHRLSLFARRAAAVQATWLGYWASTGIQAMDWLIADAVCVPEEHRTHFTERVALMPSTRFCFDAPAATPPPSETPALHRGFITFGSFQRVAKLNVEGLRLWAAVLERLPRARLRLQAVELGDARTRAVLSARLEAAGIPAARVDCFGRMERDAYLAAYSEVDVILDTCPHTGATTTCEALWMGVPTLSLAGNRLVSRQGASLLNAVSMHDWIATDADDFVERAVRLTADVASLGADRLRCRERLTESPLFDARTFTRSFQTLLHELLKST